MKTIITLIIATLLLCAFTQVEDINKVYSKTSNCDSLYTEKMNKRYSNGKDGFLKDIAKEINCPKKARENCIVGYSILNFRIDAQGLIKDIEFVNQMGFGIDEEVIRSLNSTSGKWLEAGEDTKFQLPILFLLSNKKIGKYGCESLIVISAYSSANSNCKEILSDDELLKKAEKLESSKKKNSKQLLKAYEDLARRFPFDKSYKEKIKEYQSLMKAEK